MVQLFAHDTGLSVEVPLLWTRHPIYLGTSGRGGLWVVGLELYVLLQLHKPVYSLSHLQFNLLVSHRTCLGLDLKVVSYQHVDLPWQIVQHIPIYLLFLLPQRQVIDKGRLQYTVTI